MVTRGQGDPKRESICESGHAHESRSRKAAGSHANTVIGPALYARPIDPYAPSIPAVLQAGKYPAYCAARRTGKAEWRSMEEAPSQPATTTSTTPAVSPMNQSAGCGR